jgi:GNAT superfamily N-acetyltransferase
MNKKPLEGMISYEFRTRGIQGQDYNEYLIKSTGIIILTEDNENIPKEEDRETIIGEFSYYYMDLLPIDLFGTFDAEEQYLADMASEMVDEEGEFTKKFSFMEDVTSLIILNTIELKPEYRGYGIMKGVIEFFRSHYESATILLKAHPTGFTNINKKYTVKEFNYAEKKVIKSYEKCGFKRVTKKSSYMYNEGGTIIP